MAKHDKSPTFDDILRERLDRRDFIKGLGATAAMFAASDLIGCAGQRAPDGRPTEKGGGANANNPSTLSFTEVGHSIDKSHHVSPGYRADVLLRWGDPIVPGAQAPTFPINDADAQEMLFGYNNDYICYMPLPRGSESSRRGLLCINNEYTSTELMWPGVTDKSQASREQAEVEMAAHGHTVIEVARQDDGTWKVAPDGKYNRRITLRSTDMRISGPAAGHPRMQTSTDPSGRTVVGTLANCAGGVTPWGTVLIAEENFDDYFGGDPKATSERAALERYGFDGEPNYAWHKYHARFDHEREPNEANRFGWMVEFDPYDPTSTPVKRTALGRFKHEGATTHVNPDGRLVVYSGDDEAFEYLYRFVSDGTYEPGNDEANTDLLDEGTLYVAQFDADAKLTWLPLVQGQGPLTEENGFASQADVLIDTRRAADLVGATPLDRPEDVEPNPVTGLVYVMLTNNTEREELNPVSPRENNRHGHVIELVPPGDGGERDHTADVFDWNFFLLAGDPADPAQRAQYHPAVSESGWLSCPDNVTFDHLGRIWIATDQGSAQYEHNISDGLYAADTRGDGRALTRKFFAVPIGAELCGPCFTPDNETLFLCVQHPAEQTTYDDPNTRWPDFEEGVPPRPSIVVITREGGGIIGE